MLHLEGAGGPGEFQFVVRGGAVARHQRWRGRGGAAQLRGPSPPAAGRDEERRGHRPAVRSARHGRRAAQCPTNTPVGVKAVPPSIRNVAAVERRSRAPGSAAGRPGRAHHGPLAGDLDPGPPARPCRAASLAPISAVSAAVHWRPSALAVLPWRTAPIGLLVGFVCSSPWRPNRRVPTRRRRSCRWWAWLRASWRWRTWSGSSRPGGRAVWRLDCAALRVRSSSCQRYQLATLRYGRHRSPSSASSFGDGGSACRRPGRSPGARRSRRPGGRRAGRGGR